MDFQQASPWIPLLLQTFFFLSLLLISIFIFKKKSFCNCDVCRTYITSSWSKQFTNLCDWYTHLLTNSPTSTIHIHVLNNIITANPSNVEHMLKTRFDNYPKGKPFSIILGDFLGQGIFNVDGNSWKFQKKIACSVLNTSSIRSYAFEVIQNEITQRLIPLLETASEHEDSPPVDLQDVFQRFSFDNICRFTFGLDAGCLKLSLPMSDFAAAFDTASELSAKRALLPSPFIWKIRRFLNIGSEKKLKDAIKLINVLAEEIIKERRSITDCSNKDLLSRFIHTVSDDIFLRDIIVSFILAGRDSVASALTSFFWLLSKNPNAEVDIIAESNRIMGLSQQLPSYEQLQGMHYLQAALYESMRLFPPVQFDSKFTQEDDSLPDGIFVRKGTRVTYHPYAMGRMDKIWGPDHLEFKPERWLKDGLFTPISPYKCPIFQAGVRVCLGKEMALLEMKSVVVSLLRTFEMEPVEVCAVPKFAPGLTAALIGGHRVSISKRK